MTVSGSSSLASNLTVATSQSAEDRWTDSNNANWSVSYPLAKSVTLGVGVRMSKSSDSFTRNKEPIVTQSMSSTLSYRPFSVLSFSQSAGSTFDKRHGHQETGMSYSLSVSAKPKAVGRTSGSFSYSKSGNSLRRQDLNESISARLSQKWTSRINTSVGLSESNRKRNYYAQGDEDVLETHSTFNRSITGNITVGSGKYFKIRNGVSYSLGQTLDTASDDSSNVSKRASDKESKTFRPLDAQLTLKIPHIPKLTCNVSYSKRRDMYLANRWGVRRTGLDRDVRDLSMNASLGLGVTRSDSLHTSGMVRITRNDAPDPQEPSDRDELRSNIQVNWAHTSRDFDLSARFNHTRSHTVNLHESRSANNKWRKSYSLSPSVTYDIGDAFSVSHGFGLSANYTNYDYDELLNPDNPKSHVSRNWSMSNSVTCRITNAVRLSSGYRYNESDEGAYRKKANVEEVEKESKGHAADLSTAYSFTDWLNFTIGYTFNKRREWRHTKRTRTDKTSRTMRTSVSVGARNPLSISGSYSVRHSPTYEHIDRSCQVRYTHAL